MIARTGAVQLMADAQDREDELYDEIIREMLTDCYDRHTRKFGLSCKGECQVDAEILLNKYAKAVRYTQWESS